MEDGTATMFHDLDEEIGRALSGQDGTTDDFVDAWYVGLLPFFAPPCGSDMRRASLVGVHDLQEPNGETLPMDIWSAYMASATAGDLSLEFPEAEHTASYTLSRAATRAVSEFMDLQRLYAGSFIDWEAVAASGTNAPFFGYFSSPPVATSTKGTIASIRAL